MISRRRFLQSLATGSAGVLALGGYAFGIEPHHRLEVRRYDLALPRWPRDARPLKVALVADLHAVDPWMSVDRIAAIVEATNALAPDLTLLLGDYVGTMRFSHGIMPPEEWAPPLGRLKAPLGVYGILGNHDWWWPGGPEPVRKALEAQGIGMLVNDAVRIAADGHRFWLAGTDSLVAIPTGRPGEYRSKADPEGTLARVTDDAPILHMAHEPDLFAFMQDRVAVTVSGHTHGGQVRLPFLDPLVVPSRFGARYAHGHIVEDGRHLVVSAGLGCSMLPVRFLVPPEIVLMTLRPADISPQTPSPS